MQRKCTIYKCAGYSKEMSCDIVQEILGYALSGTTYPQYPNYKTYLVEKILKFQN